MKNVAVEMITKCRGAGICRGCMAEIAARSLVTFIHVIRISKDYDARSNFGRNSGIFRRRELIQKI